MKHILIKEINSFLDSLIGYVVMVVFLVSLGLMLWVFPDTSVFTYGYAELNTFFQLSPYVLMFLVPAISMRMFTEEYRLGTLETLLTRPIRELEIIIGKFLASFFLIIIALVPTVLYVVTIHQLSLPVGNIDLAGIFGSYVGLLLLAGVFAAVGTFSSSLSGNQVIAFILAAFLCFFLYEGFQAIAGIFSNGRIADRVDQLGLYYHYRSLGKGLVDMRNVGYLLGVLLMFLFTTKLVLDARKW
jgi:ABC-2 type transport system permease protein